MKPKFHLAQSVPQSYISFSPSTAFQIVAISGEVLSVDGLPRGENKENWIMAPFLRPQKPSDVTITLTTADGKKWHATWVAETP